MLQAYTGQAIYINYSILPLMLALQTSTVEQHCVIFVLRQDGTTCSKLHDFSYCMHSHCTRLPCTDFSPGEQLCTGQQLQDFIHVAVPISLPIY